MKCWSSPDLINWTYEKYCTTEKISTGAYAPEVYYYNGKFYMYTSPGGKGHYVLESDSPTGPFKVITDNMGMSIDGSVFIDNDGKWYFYTAGNGNIQYYNMSSPSQMSGGSALANVSINGGWTEGPMVVYHDGYYYMTYTGNHVCSESYRIYYAASNKSPISYPSGADNPLLVNTSSEMVGIGHSSTVKGPDLDSYYIVYHSLESQNGPNRSMNIDRIVFNGDSMEIMGPTTAKQQVPDLPDVYAYFNAGDSLDGWTLSGSLGTTGSGLPLSAGSSFISNYRFTGNYTAEYNVTSIADGGMAGAIFSYTDANNFGVCLFDPSSQKVIISITVNGETTVKETDMVQSFKEKVKFDCVQSIQIEKNGNDYMFYMNDHQLCRIKDSALESGAIGYITQGADASFGFIGGTGAIGGQGASDEYKIVSSLSGLITANTYTTGTYATEKKGSVYAVF
ncbi:MAG: family 43 glycosylhydrolase, partial [Clostridia bacterium]|nr:family 43 glycosylhydrolase [Clostridia bacterium]